jgi:hypothetical protein
MVIKTASCEYHMAGVSVICRMVFIGSNELLLQISSVYLRLTSDGLFLSNPDRSR